MKKVKLFLATVALTGTLAVINPAAAQTTDNTTTTTTAEDRDDNDGFDDWGLLGLAGLLGLLGRKRDDRHVTTTTGTANRNH